MNSLIKTKSEYFKNCIEQNKPESLRHLEQMQDALGKNTEISKQKYYFKLSRFQKYYFKFSRKLAVNKINPKCYWSILKSFLNNKKIPCIPPLILNNQFIVDFKRKKANYLSHSLQSNVLILRREAIYPPRYCAEQMNP